MSYLTFHHRSYYFQIRVPAALEAQFGRLVRVNLQTCDSGVAKAIALRLASEWLTRFQAPEAFRASLGECSDLSKPEWALPPGNQPVVQTPSKSEPEVRGAAAAAGCKRASSVTGVELFDAWKRVDCDRAVSTVSEMRAALRDFDRSAKKDFRALTRLDISSFRDTLLSRGLARTTVAKRVGFISTLLQVGFDAGLLAQNVGRGLKIPKGTVPTLVRRTFTADELDRLFKRPVYLLGSRPSGAGGEACVWIPMIALVTGARLEEIAQLRANDILRDPLHGPLIRVTDQGEGQRVKTIGSRRQIPVHPELVASGFLDYAEAVLEAGHEWLFPALEADHDGRRGANFGKWFLRELRAPRGLGITDPRLVFHSFRHTFKTMCRAARVSEELHDALTGHVSGTVSRRYGEMPIAPLVEAVSQIELPVSLPRIM